MNSNIAIPNAIHRCLLVAALTVACGERAPVAPDGAGAPPDALIDPDAAADAPAPTPDAPALTLKPLPSGVYKSAGGLRTPTDNPIAIVQVTPAVDGVGLLVPWDLCGDDEACLLASIRTSLDAATARGLRVSLAIADGSSAPPGLKARCQLFSFTFRNVMETMCVAWDPVYLAEKAAFVGRLGAAFDDHPALAYIYFTGACSTNGVEGHCRVTQAEYTQAGYTPDRLVTAYLAIMDAYRAAFPTTPIAMEVHAIFNDASPYRELWDAVATTGRVGIAAWWCAERLAVNGQETTLVYPLVQDAAQRAFAVCQTVASFKREPFRFSDPTLGLAYGTSATDFTPDDVQRAFTDTLDWAEGRAVHAGQAVVPPRFGVYEAWSADADEPSFQTRLAAF